MDFDPAMLTLVRIVAILLAALGVFLINRGWLYGFVGAGSLFLAWASILRDTSSWPFWAVASIIMFTRLSTMGGSDEDEDGEFVGEEVEEDTEPEDNQVVFHGTEDAEYHDGVLAWPVKHMRRMKVEKKKDPEIKDPVRCPTCGKTASLSSGVCPWCGGAVLSVEQAIALKAGK